MKQLFRSELFRTVGFFAILTAISIGIVFAVSYATGAWVDSLYRGEDEAPTTAATEEELRGWPLIEKYKDEVPPAEVHEKIAWAIEAEIEDAATKLGLQPVQITSLAVESYYVVVVSPREEIRLVGIKDIPGELTAEEMAEIKLYPAAWDVFLPLSPPDKRWSVFIFKGSGGATHRDVVVGPAETPFMIYVVAHEWSHTLMNDSPISVNCLFATPEEAMVSETTAEIVAEEITSAVFTAHGWMMSEAQPSVCAEALWRPTRFAVEQLLVEGKIDEAEAFMEAASQQLCTQGKTEWCKHPLNQAFFAACQMYGGGAEGDNPTPRMVRELRAQYPTLKEFLDEIKIVGTYEEFLDLCESKGISPSP